MDNRSLPRTVATAFPAVPMSSSAPPPAPEPLAGRRYVTVLFTDIIGSSAHAETLEAEDYADVLDRFRALVRDVVPRHGGAIARMQGDGALVLFGHLGTREDDGRRAAEAAFELHAAAATLRLDGRPGASTLRLHSGIHAGLVLVVDGDIERGRFDVYGEVPNTAARIVGLAGEGEVLVSSETLGPLAHFFEATPLGRLAIRGRSKPLDVLRIDGRRAVARRIDAAADRHTVPFAGRQAELATLLAAVRDADVTAAMRTVVVIGEPGVGKTRLIGEAVRRVATSHRVLHGYCENYLGVAPLQPFLHWSRAALGWRPDASRDANEAAVAAALAALGDSGDTGDIAALHEVVLGRPSSAAAPGDLLAGLIARLATRSSLVLVLDDWQWVDDATRHALDTLSALAARLLLIVVSRPMEAAPEPAWREAAMIRLQPLAAPESASAIGAWLPGVEPFVAEEIHRQSGGTPLLIEELCHAVASGSAPLAGAGHVGLAWLDGLVASRCARLPPALFDGLQVASVLGTQFPAALLAELVPGARAVIDALQRLDFLAPDEQAGLIGFKHVLTRDAVYATVDAARRRELHRQVAQSFEALVGGDAPEAHEAHEALAFHHAAAGDAAKAAHHAERAGDRALAAMALDRARAQYVAALQALDALPSLSPDAHPRWCAIAEKLGQACVFDPLDLARGLELFRRAADLAHRTGSAATIARAEYWLGYVYYGKGEPRAAVHHCEAALAHANASGDDRLAAQVQATLGQSLASAGRYDRALPLLQQAVDRKRRQARPSRRVAVGSAYSLARIGYTLGDLGRFDDAHAALAEALDLLGEPLHIIGASVHELRCAVLLWEGRWDEAVRSGIEGADVALRCRSRYLNAMGRALAACGQWALERSAEAVRALREPTQWIEASGGAVSTSLNYGWLMDASAALGRDADLQAYAHRLLGRARAHDRHGLAMGRRALARRLAQRHGRADRIAFQLDAADRAAAARGSPREAAVNALARAEVALLLGTDRGQARRHADAALGAFETLRMRWHADEARALLRQL